jgi:hypothetical protein
MIVGVGVDSVGGVVGCVPVVVAVGVAGVVASFVPG